MIDKLIYDQLILKVLVNTWEWALWYIYNNKFSIENLFYYTYSTGFILNFMAIPAPDNNCINNLKL